MKVLNRVCLRVPPLHPQAVVSDNHVNSGIEVRLCPLSGDAEVWESGNHCSFKAYIENHNGRALVGLSYFVDQPQDRPGWSELVTRCDKLSYEEARRILNEYAVGIGMEIENEILRQRCTRRQEKEDRADRKRARRNAKRVTSHSSNCA